MKFIVMDKTDAAMVVKAPSFFDAMAQAPKLWGLFYKGRQGRPPFDALETTEEAIEDFELEWRGSDAGTRPNRALWVRRRPRTDALDKAPWLPWERMP